MSSGLIAQPPPHEKVKRRTMNIYVGNLSLTVTEAELRSEFIPFGTVTSVTLMNDAHFGSGQPRGYGYIEMPCIAVG